MNVTGRTETHYSITDITEQQAQSILEIALTVQQNENDFSLDEQETANNMRQALLASGLKRGNNNAD